MNKISEVIAAFSNATAKPAVHLTPADRDAYINESKMFGYPFIPGSFQHPVNAKGMPMLLLAQINCADLCDEHLFIDDEPWHKGLFPRCGILQFYVSPDLPALGSNYKNLCDQSNICVVYHRPHALLYHHGMPDSTIPVRPQIPLKASLVQEPMSVDDYRFNEIFTQLYHQMTDIVLSSIYDLSEADGLQVYGARAKSEHRIGGYPIFAQAGPRQYGAQYRNHDIVLLQLVSKREYGVEWWDNGTVTFLIQEQDLRRLDFSNVLFLVDCS